MAAKTVKKNITKHTKLMVLLVVALTIAVGGIYLAISRASGALVVYSSTQVTPAAMVTSSDLTRNVKLVKAEVDGLASQVDVVYVAPFGKTTLPVSYGAGCTTDVPAEEWCVEPRLVSEQACFKLRSNDMSLPAGVRLYAHDGTYKDVTIAVPPRLNPQASQDPVWQQACISSKLTSGFKTFRIAHLKGPAVLVAGAEILDTYER